MAVGRWLRSTAAALQFCLTHYNLAVADMKAAPKLFYSLKHLYGDSEVIYQTTTFWWFPHQILVGD